MKAGAFTPATRLGAAEPGQLAPLNEGGGFHPRNPRRADRTADDGTRSMKAGAFTPATPVPISDAPIVSARSMKAGAFTPATRLELGPGATVVFHAQ